MPTAGVAHAGSAAWERLAEALPLLRPRFGRVPVYPADDPGDAETLAAELAGARPRPLDLPRRRGPAVTVVTDMPCRLDGEPSRPRVGPGPPRRLAGPGPGLKLTEWPGHR